MENKYKVLSCMQGKVKKLSESKDKSFAQGLSGDGVLIEPTSRRVLAPFDGQVVIVFETKHAIIIRSDDGLAMIIHVGVDIHKLDGNGFIIHVMDGQDIKKGDLLMEIDFSYLKKIQYDVDTHILFPSLGTKKLENIHYTKINFLDELCEVV